MAPQLRSLYMNPHVRLIGTKGVKLATERHAELLDSSIQQYLQHPPPLQSQLLHDQPRLKLNSGAQTNQRMGLTAHSEQNVEGVSEKEKGL